MRFAKHLAGYLTASGVALLAAPASATAIRIEPITLDLTAPAAASVLTLRNDGDERVMIQVRVQRWTQDGGNETLAPTSDVVASPPAVEIPARGQSVVRIVRVAKATVSGEESYRALVDQLPPAGPVAGRNVKLLVRHSLPVFFTQGSATDAKLSWKAKRVGTNLVVTARNDGGRRARISGLTLRDAGGRKVEFSRGLVGYVLGHSTMSFRTPLPQSTTIAGGTVTLSGKTDRGDFNATAQVDRSE